MQAITLNVEGMSCGGGVKNIFAFPDKSEP